MPILAYDGVPNSITFTNNTSYFPQKYGGKTPDYVPDPVMNPSDYNAHIFFISSSPGFMNIDYGDGNKEQIAFKKTRSSGYIAGIKSLYTDNFKGSYGGFGYTLEDESQWIPNNPHVYIDGVEEHNIVISFTNEIVSLNMESVSLANFPILNIPALRTFTAVSGDYGDGEINEDRIGSSINIEVLSIGESHVKNRWKNWPKAFLKLTELKTLSVNNDCDFSDLDNSNFRELKVWKKLTHANFNACCIPKYVKEFNDLPNLTNLSIAPSIAACGVDAAKTYPDFSEVDKINPSIRTFYIMSYGTNDLVDNWKEWISGKGLENLTFFWIEGCRSLPFGNIPMYFKEMRSLTTIGAGRCFNTLDKIDSFINAFYEYITSWDSISMSADASDGDRNQFYGLQIVTYNPGYNEQYRPSGILQAPSGFSQGQSNGTPTTPMEKIYVLTNNYKQVWTLKPEEAASDAARAFTAATPYSLSIVEDRVYFGTGDMVSPGEVFNFQTPDDAKRFLTSFNYPTDAIDEYVKQQNEGGPA